jgi:L-aminopeptidase/D-esterase-like protein
MGMKALTFLFPGKIAPMKKRARDLQIPFDGQPGQYNAITDVPGVTVGMTTLIYESERGSVRTGVTAVRPRGEQTDPCYAAWYSLNGCGEMTGTVWLEESGMLYGPVMLTNTFSVGTVHQATIDWVLRSYPVGFGLPVVTETYDGLLNDVRGFHVKPDHVDHALENASGGPVGEGNVGGGTGMVCYEFKGGTGTASRLVNLAGKTYTLGALVQANHGTRHQLTIAGVPVGKEITDLLSGKPPIPELSKNSSIVVVLASDLPLLPHQIKRLARRVPIGLARTGAISEYSSGDIFIAFSTVPLGSEDEKGLHTVQSFNDWRMDPLFEAVAQVVEEAVINVLCAAETMVGKDGAIAHALPQDRLVELMKKYGRLA